MPIVQIASTALRDANDALLGVHCSALPSQAPGSPSQMVPFRGLPPHTPFTHFVRSKSSSLAYQLAFVIYIYIYIRSSK